MNIMALSGAMLSALLLLDSCAREAEKTPAPTSSSPPAATAPPVPSPLPSPEPVAGGTPPVGSTAPEGEVVAIVAQLDIEVRLDEGAEPKRATLVCDEAGFRSTGFINDAALACKQASLLKTFLINGPRPDEMCTMQYGGPETARVTGTIDGQPVDRELHRRNGCGIARWSGFSAAVGAPAPTQQ